MSVWTHVNGSIRVDHIRPVMGPLDLKSLFRTASYEDGVEEAKACNVPQGSEGSLHVSIWEEPLKAAMAAYTVNVFGDLRDFDDVEELRKWFEKIVLNSGLMIRSAVMECEVEGQPGILFVYVRGDKGKVVSVAVPE